MMFSTTAKRYYVGPWIGHLDPREDGKPWVDCDLVGGGPHDGFTMPPPFSKPDNTNHFTLPSLHLKAGVITLSYYLVLPSDPTKGHFVRSEIVERIKPARLKHMRDNVYLCQRA